MNQQNAGKKVFMIRAELLADSKKAKKAQAEAAAKSGDMG